MDKGVVKLTGIVRDETEKEYASSDLANISGVKTVLNNLEIHDNSFQPAPTPGKAAGTTGPQDPHPCSRYGGPGSPNGREIDTKTAQAGSTFHATTTSNVGFGGYTLIPAGTNRRGGCRCPAADGHRRNLSGSAHRSAIFTHPAI